MDVPEFNDELVDLVAGQSDAQSGHKSIRELERLRDDNLVAMMRALKATGSGAGGVIKAHEEILPEAKSQDLPITVNRAIPQSWTDYNGHMNETHYIEIASQATDRFMQMIGADAAYIAAGRSYFTVENHIQYLSELHAGDEVTVSTHVLLGEGKKMHLFHMIHDAEGTLAATVETYQIHMDLKARKASLPADHVAQALARFAMEHAALPIPNGVGRYVGQRNAS